MGNEAEERAGEQSPGLDCGFGALLRHYRQASGLSQQALAERARLSVRGIADLERGARRFPYPETIERLAEALDLQGAERTAMISAGRRSSKRFEVAHAVEPSGVGARRHNLPEQLPTLIGRDEAVLTLRRQLEQGQTGLLTLTGPGGSGKTRLALAVATEALDCGAFRDGVRLVELAPVADPMLVADVVAASVGVKERLGRPIRETLLEELSARSLLLVLDNCEHLVEACAALAQDLLRICAGVRILSTSREPLRVGGERVWRVPPLPTPDAGVAVSVDELAKNPAVQLFVERAQAVESTLTLTPDSITTIAEICRRLDGLPLVIELAAARARVLTPAQILERLGDAIRLLVGGSRTAPTRQQTLRATLDWSYLLLSPAEQQRFERLAVFAGGFNLDAVVAIWLDDCGSSAADALDMLTALVDRSLVTPQQQAGHMRYRMLEPVRQYAQERLIEHGGWEAARKKHVDYFLELAERGSDELVGVDAQARMVRLELEHDNLRAVLRRSLDAGDPATALRMASALRNFWRQFSHRNEAMSWFRETLAYSTNVDPALQARSLYATGEAAYHLGSLQEAKERFEEATQLRRKLGDRAGLATVLGYYGRAVTRTARTAAEYERGKALMSEAIAHSRECGAQWWAAWAMMLLGQSLKDYAELGLAATVLGEGAAILTQLGELHAHSHIVPMLGSVLCRQGDLERGRALIEQGLAESRAGNYCADGIAEPLYFLALIARSRGDMIVATQQAVEGLLIMNRAGNPAPLADSFELLGGLACDQGLPERAATLFSAAAALREKLGLPMPPIQRAAYERDLVAARDALGSHRFDECWAKGLATNDHQVIEYASQIPTAATPADL